ncbi:PREDICTED: uncharacterized protein LOC106904818 isoform X2 [Poecilia mexicana]|uniref:uncharacterized protein LOC106904818 isoform X2 n=1 Tax=Poecilia mexicana TaxID=48701 RepID=UPI00072EB5A9|nr:PREDICTED: uncharacterized protein LOC106904818 isoform X2 [Poecilia mexicana]
MCHLKLKTKHRLTTTQLELISKEPNRVFQTTLVRPAEKKENLPSSLKGEEEALIKSEQKYAEQSCNTVYCWKGNRQAFHFTVLASVGADMSLSPIVVAILVFLTIHEGSVVGDQVVNLRCRCITKERKPIGRHILVLEVHPASSHCAETQIIATLKKDKRKVCLDPNAPWVIRVMQNRRAKQKVQEQTTKA